MSLNNFAGIAHCDTCASGGAFASVPAGIEAQMQELKFYALGNSAPTAYPRIAPYVSSQYAGTRSTWASLTGSWATDPGYWSAINSTYSRLSGGTVVLAAASTGSSSACGTVSPTNGGASGNGSCGPILNVALAAAPDDRARTAINAACTQIGKPYQWGAGHGDPTFDINPSPAAFECSSFVGWAWAHGGVRIDGTTYTQVALGIPVADLAKALPGDLVFLDGDSHVGMYLGQGQMINAPNTGSFVRVEKVWAAPDVIRRVG